MKFNDVFLSFRGEEIRKTFLSHLLTSFKKKDITTFTSSESSFLSLQALNESLVAIPVFSKNLESLDLWVDDLAKIIACEKKKTLTVVPIFFQLESFDISNMLRNAGKKAQSMQGTQRETLKTVMKWLGGYVTKKSGFYSYDCKDDSELVKKVTSFVSDVLTSSTSRRYQSSSIVLRPDRSLKLADAFRLDPIVKKFSPLLWRLRDNTGVRRSLCLKDLRSSLLSVNSALTGIYGIQGVGKTSLVSHIYDDISPQFQYHCFINNRTRRQAFSCRPSSLVTDLVYEAFKESSFHGRSKEVIKEMIRHRKVLLVVDDVDATKELKGIIKEATWFGPGSQVIVITQDKSLLTQCGVLHVYELESPKYEEALAFFSEFAFKQTNPLPGFEALSSCAVQVSNHLPLALKMLGSFLCDKEKDEWVSTLRRLEASHNNYATEVCRYVGADDYAPRRPMKVDQHIGVDEANRFPFYRFALK